MKLVHFALFSRLMVFLSVVQATDISTMSEHIVPNETLSAVPAVPELFRGLRGVDQRVNALSLEAAAREAQQDKRELEVGLGDGKFRYRKPARNEDDDTGADKDVPGAVLVLSEQGGL